MSVISPTLNRLVAFNGVAAPAFINFTPSSTAGLRGVIAGVLGGTRADMCILGASQNWGAWSDNTANGLFSQTIGVYLSNWLNANSVVPAEYDSWLGAGILTTFAAWTTRDTRIGGNTFTPNSGETIFPLGGYTPNNSTSGNILANGFQNLNPSISYDFVDVLFLNMNTGGNFDVGTPAGVIQNITRDAGIGLNVPRKVTVNMGSAFSTTVRITQKSTVTINIMGVHPYLSTAVKLGIITAGVPGLTSGQAVDTSQPYNMLAGLAALAPGILAIQLNGNDMAAGTALATMVANISTIIDAQTGRGGASMLFIDSQRNPSAALSPVTPIPYQQVYANAVIALAIQKNIPCVVIPNVIGTFAAVQAKGLIATDNGANPPIGHLLAAGNQLVAEQAYGAAIKKVMAFA